MSTLADRSDLRKSGDGVFTSAPSARAYIYDVGLQQHVADELARRDAEEYWYPKLADLGRPALRLLLALVDVSFEWDDATGWENTTRRVPREDCLEALDGDEVALMEAMNDLRGGSILETAWIVVDGETDAVRLLPQTEKPEIDPDEHVTFPDELWRMPIPNRVFAMLPELTGSAVRALLLLIRSSFWYDPAQGWTHGGRWKTISELQHAADGNAGVTRPGLHNGLNELSERGLVEVDRRGRSNHYMLLVEPSRSGYTWVPSDVLERSGTLTAKAVRVLLTIYRGTWGWTRREDGETVHKRAVQLSTADLVRRTGLSETSVREAVKELMGRWINRVRPRPGAAYVYEPGFSFLPDDKISEGGTYSLVRRDKSSNTRPRKSAPSTSTSSPASVECRLGTEGKGRDSDRSKQTTGEVRRRETGPNDVPPGKIDLYRELRSIGVHHGPAVQHLRSRRRRLIEATIELYEDAIRSGQTIRNPGGWVSKALQETWAATTPEREETRKRDPRPGRRSSTDPTPVGEIATAVLGDAPEPKTYTWPEARQIIERLDLLERMPSLDTWFTVELRPDGSRRFIPTKRLRQLLNR